jgi:hypothetical protein
MKLTKFILVAIFFAGFAAICKGLGFVLFAKFLAGLFTVLALLFIHSLIRDFQKEQKAGEFLRELKKQIDK